MWSRFSRVVSTSTVAVCMLTGSFGHAEAAPGAATPEAQVSGTAPRDSDRSAGNASKIHRVFKLPTPELESSAAAPVVRDSLEPVLEMAQEAHRQVQANIRDYSCILVRRERVEGRLGNHEFIFAKIRHAVVEAGREVTPFSVYLKFLKPSSVAGREVLFVQGQNDGEMFARRGGTRFAFVTTKLRPDSELAMRGNRHPITEIGVDNLLSRLIQSAKDTLQEPCEVQYLPKAKINGRASLGIVVRYKEQRPDQPYYQAKIFVDEELQVPLHYESYDWPSEGSKEPPLLEQYTYTKLQINQGFSEADFSENNPEYQVK